MKPLWMVNFIGISHTEELCHWESNMNKKWKNFVSPPNILAEEHLGNWLHISTVFDALHQKVKHYINGKKVADLSIQKNLPITFGKMAIGNYSDHNALKRKPRSFHGRIDDLIILKKALSDSNMKNLYQQGAASSYPFKLTNYQRTLKGQPIVYSIRQ